MAAAVGATDPRHPRKLRVRSLLLLVVLIPTLGMTAMAATTAKSALDKRDAARQVSTKADALAVHHRRAPGHRRGGDPASVVSIASDLGTNITTLGSLYGVDYAAEMRAARHALDHDARDQDHARARGRSTPVASAAGFRSMPGPRPSTRSTTCSRD